MAVDVHTGLRSCRAGADGTAGFRVPAIQPAHGHSPRRHRHLLAAAVVPRMQARRDVGDRPAAAHSFAPTSPGLLRCRARRGTSQRAAVRGGRRRRQGLYWFVDDRLVATAAPGDDEFWTPRAGRFTVRVVDDLGRADAVAVRVAAAPVRTPG